MGRERGKEFFKTKTSFGIMVIKSSRRGTHPLFQELEHCYLGRTGYRELEWGSVLLELSGQ